MDKLKLLITALIALAMIGFFVWALLPEDDFSDKIKEKLNKDKQKADVMFKDATLAEVYDGIKYWELVARTAVINKSVGKADLSVVDGLFFDKGRPTIKFLAPSAVWRIKKNEIYLSNPIGYDIKYEKIIKTELAKVKDITRLHSVFHLPERIGEKYKGYWFSAKNLNWSLSTKKLFCSGAITLTKGDMVINAEKLEADVGLKNVILTGHPSGEIFADSKKIIINADSFFVDSYKDIIIADKNVRIKRNGARIAASKAAYDQQKAVVRLYGDVFLTDGQITAFSKNASYDTQNNRITLTEKAKAKRDGNEVYGDSILVLLGQNKIIIKGRTKAKIKEAEIK
jgi:lipopolysaccharide transport protein LptA